MGLTRGAAQAGRKGGRAGEAARTLGHTIHAHVFPYSYMSTGGLMVSNSAYDSQAPVFESFGCSIYR